MPTITKEQALRELARRRGLLARPGTFRLEDHLFDKQLAFVQDPSPFKCGVTTRRAGKTIACVADLTHTAIVNPDCIVLYITLSRKNAKRLVWPEFKKLNVKYQLGGEVNESDLSITYPNGSVAYILGASDRTSIEDFRGLAIKKAYLDESQSFPAYIEQLINDVLSPALMDHAGQLVLIGTPGPVPSGYFFDLTKNPEWSHHFWSFFDNPKLPFLAQGQTHQDALNRELKRRGVSKDDPSILREWYGQWVVDTSSLVYRYNQEKNDYGLLPSGRWTYILGVDLGFKDCDALALLAYSDADPCTYLVEERVTRNQDITSLCKQIDELVARYDITKIVVDTGGLGKKITEEISKRYKVPMVAAEKTRKAEYIGLLNDSLRTSRFKVKASSLFAHDSQKLEWDWDKSTPDRMVVSDRFHSDICDAVLYAWRESYSYTFQQAPKELEYGSQAWSNAEAEAMFQATLERAEAAREESGEYISEELSLDDSNIQKLDRPKGRYHDRFLKRNK